MTNSMTVATRLAAAALVAGAALGTAQATDWDKLQSKDWGNAPGGQVAAGDTGSGGSGADAGAEIASAFEGLGMAAARAECYGEVLSQKLSGAERQEAAELVRTAANGDDVRSAVLNAGPGMVGAFSAADASCPDDMGS